MNKLNIERAVLEEWFRLGGHNWNLHTNWCSDLPLNEWYSVTTSENGKITGLSLNYNNIESVPSELSQLTNLKYLDLSDNNLCLVPSELSQLKNLKYLFLDNNYLTLVPSELAQLKKLTDLYFNNNNISSVPSELSQLENLTIYK